MIFTKELLTSRFDNLPQYCVTQQGVPTIAEICSTGKITANNLPPSEDYNEFSSVTDIGDACTDVFDALVAARKIEDLDKEHRSKLDYRKRELEKYKSDEGR